jgi:hypothetical protein
MIIAVAPNPSPHIGPPGIGPPITLCHEPLTYFTR